MSDVHDADIIEREPVPAPVEEEQPAVEAAPVEADGGEGEPGEGSGSEEEQKPRKSPVAQLQGRVGHLTRTLHERDREKAELQAELERYKANAPAPSEDKPLTAADVQREAERIATERVTAKQREDAQAAFVAECNKVYADGQKAFPDFDEAVTSLNSMGLMSDAFVEAAIATDEAARVLHHLGGDIDEAARIAALPPIRMTAELAKLAARLSAPKSAGVSKAPAPIKPIGGSAKAEADIYDENLSDDEYYAQRKKQGAKFIR